MRVDSLADLRLYKRHRSGVTLYVDVEKVYEAGEAEEHRAVEPYVNGDQYHE